LIGFISRVSIKDSMKTRITMYAPAKINLHLDVLGKRTDGFHDLSSVFVMVSLFDTLEVERTEGDECVITGCEGIDPDKNIILRAFQEYRKKSLQVFGSRVRCIKRIPPMAGLGGGSSDCAAMLRALELCGKAEGLDGLGRVSMNRAAAELGSDVPFFLGSTAAYVEGRGEILEKLPLVESFPLIIIKPEIDISTKNAFEWLDQSIGDRRKSLTKEDIVRAFRDTNPRDWPFFNSFTPVLIQRFSIIGHLLRALDEAGAAYSNVSGSGSSVFGIFTSQKAAEKAQKTLKHMTRNVWKLKMLASMPEAVYNGNRLE